MTNFPVNEASFTREVAIVSLEIDLSHKDPADHFIAASALVFDLTLITADDRLAKAKWLPTRSR